MGEPTYFGVYFDLPPITEAIGKIKRILKIQPTPFYEGLSGDVRLVCPPPSDSRTEHRIRRSANRPGAPRLELPDRHGFGLYSLLNPFPKLVTV